jgi:predicted transcriptional regulator
LLGLGNRRSNIEVVADILRLGEASVSEIMYATKLSHTQMKRYLSRLVKLELLRTVEPSDGMPMYRVTPKAVGLLKEIDYILETLYCVSP